MNDGPVCHDEATHENHDEYTNEADCEAAGHHWMESGEEEHHHFAMTVVLDDATHHFEVEEDEAPDNASGMMDVGMAALNLSVGMECRHGQVHCRRCIARRLVMVLATSPLERVRLGGQQQRL